MKIKSTILICLCFIAFNSYAQNNKFSLTIGRNTGFVNSISRISPSGIYTYNKNNNGNDDLIQMPNFNIGINYERSLIANFSIFLGIHSSRTETSLVFQNFNNSADYSSFIKYGYSVNTYELPIGIMFSFPVSNYFIIKNYFAITMNLNGLSEGVIKYRLITKNTNSDTISLNFNDIKGFPIGNSLGFRYGIGITPFKKYNNWEFGAYLNLQFRRSLTWNQEVEFKNESQNTNEYHQAILKDKPDYLNFHIKYTFPPF